MSNADRPVGVDFLILEVLSCHQFAKYQDAIAQRPSAWFAVSSGKLREFRVAMCNNRDHARSLPTLPESDRTG